MTHMLKNRFRTDRWKKDSIESVDLYNQWFMNCAPKAYRRARNGVNGPSFGNRLAGWIIRNLPESDLFSPEWQDA